jgi:alpha-D-ribose 1-methylphosphonate 5-triphosphate synthase subunit PhnL
VPTASLTNKEEQLSTMLLEDKNNQGENMVCIFNGPQLVNQESTKIKKG